MDKLLIKPGMMLSHITDVMNPPQKLFVLKVRPALINVPEEEDNCIYCEWLDRTGNLQKMWFHPDRLENWYLEIDTTMVKS